MESGYTPIPSHPVPPRSDGIKRGVAGLLVAGALVVGIVGGAVGGKYMTGGLTMPSVPVPTLSTAPAATPSSATNPSTASIQPSASAASDASGQSDLTRVARAVGPAVVSVRTESGLGSGVIYG